MSTLIQRELKTKRGREISSYLENEKERFFSSFVVALYGGSPQWYPTDLMPDEDEVDMDSVSEDALNTLGFLRLSGEEKLFALDGQHRLAGIKNALKKGIAIGEDEVSVIIVAHKNDPIGLRRTRRLFTTLNKKAVAVSKGEIIALDENDVMAIVSRMLIEETGLFSGKRIAIKTTNNITERDRESLTTIGNLYDLLTIVFSRIKDGVSPSSLKNGPRPKDEELAEYLQLSIDFFELLSESFKPLNEFFKSNNQELIVRKYRGEFGGNVLFRPIGLSIFFEVIASLCKDHSLEESIVIASTLPTDLSEYPFVDALWLQKTSRINSKAKTVVRDVLLVEAGAITQEKKVESIEERYQKILV